MQKKIYFVVPVTRHAMTSNIALKFNVLMKTLCFQCQEGKLSLINRHDNNLHILEFNLSLKFNLLVKLLMKSSDMLHTNYKIS